MIHFFSGGRAERALRDVESSLRLDFGAQRRHYNN
jgi:hypothetical protein